MIVSTTTCHLMASPAGRLAQAWHRMTGRKKPVPAYARQPVPWPPACAITEENSGITDAEISDIRKLIYGVKRPMTNQEIADRLGISKGHCSREVTRLVMAGFLERRKVGREVAIHERGYWRQVLN